MSVGGTDNPAFSNDECQSSDNSNSTFENSHTESLQNSQITVESDYRTPIDEVSSANQKSENGHQQSFVSQHYVEPARTSPEPQYKTETRIELPAENQEKLPTPTKSNGVNGNRNNNDASFLNTSTTSVQSNDGKKEQVEAVNLELVSMRPYSGANAQTKGQEACEVPADPYEEYFVPVNEHRKYIRGEKLYVTKDKRSRSSYWRRIACWGCGLLILAIAVIIAILAATGVILTQEATQPLETNEHTSSRQFSDIKTSGSQEYTRNPPASPPPESSSLSPWPTTDETPYEIIPKALDGTLALDNLTWTEEMNDPKSRVYRDVSQQIEMNLKEMLHLAENLSVVKVYNISRNGEVKFRISYPPVSTPEQMQLNIENMLQKSGNMVGNYHLSKLNVAHLIDDCKHGQLDCSEGCRYDYSEGIFVCSCPTGRTLEADGKTCQDDNDLSNVNMDEHLHHEHSTDLAHEPIQGRSRGQETTFNPTHQELDHAHTHTEESAEPEPTSEPKSEPELTSEPNAEPEPSSEPEPNSEPKAEPEPSSEPEPTSEPKAEPEPSSEPEPASEPKAEPEPSSEPEPTSEPKAEPEPSSEPEPTSEPKAEAKPSSEPEPTSEPKAEPEPSSEPEPTSEPKAEAEPSSEPEPTSEPKVEPEPSTEPEPASEPNVEPEPPSEPEPVSEPNAEPEPASEPTSEPQPSMGLVPVVEPTAEPKSEPEPSSEPNAEPEPASEPTSEPQPPVGLVPVVEPTAEPKSEPEPVTEVEPEGEPKPEPESTAEPKPEIIPSAEPTSEPVASVEPIVEPHPSTEPEPTSEPGTTSESETESSTMVQMKPAAAEGPIHAFEDTSHQHHTDPHTTVESITELPYVPVDVAEFDTPMVTSSPILDENFVGQTEPILISKSVVLEAEQSPGTNHNQTQPIFQFSNIEPVTEAKPIRNETEYSGVSSTEPVSHIGHVMTEGLDANKNETSPVSDTQLQLENNTNSEQETEPVEENEAKPKTTQAESSTTSMNSIGEVAPVTEVVQSSESENKMATTSEKSEIPEQGIESQFIPDYDAFFDSGMERFAIVNSADDLSPHFEITPEPESDLPSKSNPSSETTVVPSGSTESPIEMKPESTADNSSMSMSLPTTMNGIEMKRIEDDTSMTAEHEKSQETTEYNVIERMPETVHQTLPELIGKNIEPLIEPVTNSTSSEGQHIMTIPHPENAVQHPMHNDSAVDNIPKISDENSTEQSNSTATVQVIHNPTAGHSEPSLITEHPLYPNVFRENSVEHHSEKVELSEEKHVEDMSPFLPDVHHEKETTKKAPRLDKDEQDVPNPFETRIPDVIAHHFNENDNHTDFESVLTSTEYHGIVNQVHETQDSTTESLAKIETNNQNMNSMEDDRNQVPMIMTGSSVGDAENKTRVETEGEITGAPAKDSNDSEPKLSVTEVSVQNSDVHLDSTYATGNGINEHDMHNDNSTQVELHNVMNTSNVSAPNSLGTQDQSSGVPTEGEENESIDEALLRVIPLNGDLELRVAAPSKLDSESRGLAEDVNKNEEITASTEKVNLATSTKELTNELSDEKKTGHSEKTVVDYTERNIEDQYNDIVEDAETNLTKHLRGDTNKQEDSNTPAPNNTGTSSDTQNATIAQTHSDVDLTKDNTASTEEQSTEHNEVLHSTHSELNLQATTQTTLDQGSTMLNNFEVPVVVKAVSDHQKATTVDSSSGMQTTILPEIVMHDHLNDAKLTTQVPILPAEIEQSVFVTTEASTKDIQEAGITENHISQKSNDAVIVPVDASQTPATMQIPTSTHSPNFESNTTVQVPILPDELQTTENEIFTTTPSTKMEQDGDGINSNAQMNQEIPVLHMTEANPVSQVTEISAEITTAVHPGDEMRSLDNIMPVENTGMHSENNSTNSGNVATTPNTLTTQSVMTTTNDIRPVSEAVVDDFNPSQFDYKQTFSSADKSNLGQEEELTEEQLRVIPLDKPDIKKKSVEKKSFDKFKYKKEKELSFDDVEGADKLVQDFKTPTTTVLSVEIPQTIITETMKTEDIADEMTSANNTTEATPPRTDSETHIVDNETLISAGSADDVPQAEDSPKNTENKTIDQTMQEDENLSKSSDISLNNAEVPVDAKDNTEVYSSIDGTVLTDVDMMMQNSTQDIIAKDDTKVDIADLEGSHNDANAMQHSGTVIEPTTMETIVGILQNDTYIQSRTIDSKNHAVDQTQGLKSDTDEIIEAITGGPMLVTESTDISTPAVENVKFSNIPVQIPNQMLFSKCTAGQFQCVNGTSRDGAYCVSLASKCDSENDCSDGSDEINCEQEGCPGNFQCSSGQCLKRHLVCNGIEDCDDGTDEKSCEAWQCQFDEFQCPNGRCIPILWQCNGRPDCENHRDEYSCAESCGNNEYLCPTEKWCIPLTWHCNGIPECANGEDEKLCDCALDQFKCQVGGCVPLDQVCDGVEHCPDHSDEWDCLVANMTIAQNSTEIQKDDDNEPHGDTDLIARATVLKIRQPNGDRRLVCSDNWTTELSDLFCREQGYFSSESTDMLPLNEGLKLLKLKSTVAPKAPLVSHLEPTEICETGKIVQISCQEFSCGSHYPEGPTARLVGGTRAGEGQWSSVALLKEEKNGVACTASVLSPMHALASYSCIHKYRQSNSWQLFTGGDMSIAHPVKSIVPYPQVKYNQFLYNNDMALVELEEPLTFSRNVSAVCLPRHSIQPRQLCVTAGWGFPMNGEVNLQQYLKFLPVPTYDSEECNATSHYAGFITKDNICAGFTDTDKGPCYNDEGAPLMCASESGRWELQGLLSHHSRCSRGHPAIYSSLAPALSWLHHSIPALQARP